MSRGDGFVDAIIRMRGISKSFGSLRANDSIDFELYPGETHALVGENGAGKTTLMRILYGQYKADSGTIEVDGKPVTYNVAGAMKLGIGMVHQNFMQIEKMSILENIIMASAPSRFGFIRYKETRGKVQEMLRRFGLEVSPDVPIGRLCVGERQKVEIIKALYLGARVLILDEPTAGLDPQGRDEILGQIERLNREHGLTILVVSHSMEDMARYVDRIMVMNDGVKMFDDTPKEVFRHYKELEAIGLAAPQITYVVQELRERGIPIDDAITTVEEAREAILALYNKRREKQ